MTDSPPREDSAPAGAPVLSLPDSHGRAALLLVESLIHGLIARSLISATEALDIVETAAEVDVAITEAGPLQAIALTSSAILGAIGASLKIDAAG